MVDEMCHPEAGSEQVSNGKQSLSVFNRDPNSHREQTPKHRRCLWSQVYKNDSIDRDGLFEFIRILHEVTAA